MTHAELNALVQPMLETLGEHCDAIQIMMTWNEDGNTHRYKIGAGNWYARQGMAHEFINEDQAQTNAREISEAINPPDAE